MIRQLQKLIVAVARHHEPHHEFIANRERLARCHGLERRPRLRKPLHEQLLLDRQLLTARGGHVRDVVEILPVDPAPGDSLVGLLDNDVGQPRRDLAAREPLLEEARACLDHSWLHRLAAYGHGHSLLRGEQIVAAAKQRRDRVGRGPVAFPAARALLREQPRLQPLDGRRVAGHLVERLDHDRLRLDRRARPAPPHRMRIAPPHPLPVAHVEVQLAVEPRAPLLEAIDDRECGLSVAGSLERNRQVPLRAAMVDLHPALLAHVEPPGVGLRRRAGEWHVFVEETAGVEREGADRREHGLPHLLRPVLFLDEPIVEPGDRSHRRLHVDLDAARPQPAEAGDDPERDRVARAPSREPRPATVGVAERVEPGERRLDLVRRAIGVEQERDPGPGLLLVHGLAHPRRLGEERSHEIRVLLQWALQGLRALPLFEHLRDPRVTGGEVPRERVGIQPRE